MPLYPRRPEPALDGDDDASERAIGSSEARRETLRGYKSDEGMSDGVVLTRWPYSGEDEHDLLAEGLWRREPCRQACRTRFLKFAHHL